MLTPDELAARTERAVAAAAAAGRDLGLRVDDPRVLYDAFSVIVALDPSPVVVRVPTVLPRSLRTDPDRQTAQQQSELAAAGWLADHGHPVVPPSPLVPREPVRRDGFSMTFWQFVEQVPATETDFRQRFGKTARLHTVLRDYVDHELTFWTQFGTYITDALDELEQQPDLLDAADLQRAQRQWETIGPLVTSRTVFESRFPGVDVQPVHGDAPYYNMIATPDGELWSDFELVTLAPVESDLALADPAGKAAYNAAAEELGLRPLNDEVLAVAEAAAQLTVVACMALVPQLPMLLDGLKPTLDVWRSQPPTGLQI